MKGRKLLAGFLSAAMVLGTMSFPVFADGETDVYTIGAGKTYETFADALNADDTDSNGIITYEIYGKVVLPDGGIRLGKDGITTINFTKGSEDAELSLEGTGFNLIGFDHAADLKEINYTGLKLSRLNGSYVGDAAHLNQFFTTTIRTNSDGIVTYTDCTFPNGSGSNTYGKTVYNNCTFSNTDPDSKYNVWIRGGATEINGGTVTGAAGIKLYSDDPTKVFGDTKIDGVNFEDITKKPAIVATQQGKIEITNSTVSNCEYGLIANESNQGADLADITVDGKAPAYVSSVDGNLYTETTYAEKEASEKGKDAEAIVAMVEDKYYTSIDAAVAAAQAATTDKWHIAKITLLTNDALDISKGPDNYVSYNITKNDTVVTGERIADDAHKSYYKLTNASTLYIPADVNSLILENVKNLCNIEIAEGADVTLKLNGDNELAGNILVPEGAKLTIEDITTDGTGRLAVYNTADKKYLPGMNAFGAGNGYSAAIGGSMTQPGGKIVIESGEIEAYSNYGAAIGGGQQQTAKVTILGGKIKAEASYGTAIGGGQQSIGDVTISGGVIDAKSDRSAPIGGGNQATADSNIIISGGDITVARDFGTNLFGNSTGESAGAKISGGTFNTDVSDYCTDSFSPKLVNGVYVVDNAAGVITVNFKQRDDDKNSYDIVLKGDGEGIYEFVSAELQFENNSKTLSGESMNYEITGTDNVNVIANTENTDRYGFYLKDGAASNRLSGAEVIIGKITFPAQGKRDFKVTATESTVITTLKGTHLETTYTATGVSKLEAGAPINDEVTAATRNVLVKVDYAHALVGSWTDNQMTVTLKNAFGETSAPQDISDGLAEFASVPVGRITVTLKAPGFRTFTYTTTVEEGTDPLVLSFWNDTKRDTTAEVEPGKAMINNFVVGDIAMDYIVDKYDLAAVTSYYGTYGLTDVNKIKYDLNRDGNIDITDVAYVLHNFGF